MNRSVEVPGKLPVDLEWIEAPAPGLKLAFVHDSGIVPLDVLLAALPLHEQEQAGRVVVAEEQRHFVFRRACQRSFVSQILPGEASLDAISISHAIDQRPVCEDAPGICLSFSSSQRCYLFGAGVGTVLGVDIERMREISNAAELARRFFTKSEAEFIESFPRESRSLQFLTLWSAKEAGLKALGRGIVSGLNAFTFSPEEGKWFAQQADDSVNRKDWLVSSLLQPVGFVGTVVSCAPE